MRLEETYVKKGYFWLPGKEDRQIPGTLTIFNGGDIKLEVLGCFDDSLGLYNDEDNLSRILGHVEKDGLVTLEHCFDPHRARSLDRYGSISQSTWNVRRVLSGVAYQKDEPFTCNSLEFAVDCLDEWVGISGIKRDRDWKNNKITINYELPLDIAFSLDNGMRLEICFDYTCPGLSRFEAKITQIAFFKLTSEELRPLEDFIDIAYKLTNLMCFAIDATVALKNLIARSSEIQEEIETGIYFPTPIYIYRESYAFAKEVPNKNSYHMLFGYQQIESNAQDIFNNWINAYDVIKPTIDLYFATKTNEKQYVEAKFLFLAQGLETYHRRTSDETLMDSGTFESLVANMVAHCPDEHRKWLEGRLKYGNEINLRKRLKKIIEPFQHKLGGKKKIDKLVMKIVDTRNYLTHYSGDLKDKAASGLDLWNLCKKMEVIFQLHFLKYIGFSDEEIDSIVKSCDSLKHKIAAT